MATLLEKLKYLNKLRNKNKDFRKLDKFLLSMNNDKKEIRIKTTEEGNFVFYYPKGNKSIELAVRKKGQTFALYLGRKAAINQVTDVNDAIRKIVRYLY